MTRRVVGDEAIDRYLDAARAGQVGGARDVAMQLIDQGVDLDSVIVDLLCAAQREVGERWHRNEWSVADEHLVSAMTQRVMDAVVAGMPPVPVSRGHVLVACAEGDWHSLPAQAIAEVLRTRGWDVSFLGASTPASHVGLYLDRRPAIAVAVSCSVPLTLMGVRRLVVVAHERRIPVLVGGLALGTDARRATMLGADAWAPNARAAVEALEVWEAAPPTLLTEPAPVPSAYSTLEARAAELARTADARLERLVPDLARVGDEQRARALEELESSIRFVAAASLVDDDRVLVDFVDWLREFLTRRGVPQSALHAGIQEVCDVLAAVDPEVAALARRGLVVA